MADSDSKAPASIKRWRIGLNVVVQVVLLMVIVGVVNMLSCQKNKQWDYTPSKRYSLGQATEQILKNLSDDLFLTVAFSRSSDTYHYTKRMLELYQGASGGRLKVRWVDPIRDPSIVAELRDQDPQLAFDQNKILISKSESLQVEGENGLEVAPYQVVSAQDMFLRAENLMFRDGRTKRGNVTEYRLERALTSGIVAATQERERVAYIITGHGEMRTVQGKSAGGTLMLEGGVRQNLQVRPLPMTDNTVIPKDAGVVMMVAPNQDFSGAELKAIFQDYWEKRKGGLVLLLDPLSHPFLPNLRNYLQTYYGVRWEDDRVLTMKNQGGRNLKNFQVPGWFQAGSPVTESLVGRSCTFPMISSTLNTRVEGAADDPIAPAAVDKKVLIAANYAVDGYWKEKDHEGDPTPVADLRETQDIHLAVSVEKGAGINQSLRLNSSRMVIVGNGNLVDPDLYTRESIEFVLNSINWASDRDDMVTGIDTQQTGNYRLDIGDRPYGKLEWMALRILPVIVFLIGLVVAFFRRR